uniref:Uncharacterized protein n=1 Tax=Tanacetum cinerariifolium TaxID=118510 RepID=A0A699GN81_TANCI|nr:hypothetical protein [Tanacetum cinerariifolium]
MNPIATQQVALHNALIQPKKTLKIKICYARIAFNKTQREETHQVTLEALKKSPCYPAFVINAEGMYNKKNVDYVALLWEDFMYQADNQEISSSRKEHMPYPRFTKVTINYFISKDKTISMRNMINLHIIHDDSMLGTLKFVSKTQDYQQYGALIPDDMINQDIKDFKAYKTYYDFATGKVPPRKVRKYKKVASPSRKLDTPSVSVSKKKAPDKADRSKEVPDEKQHKTSGTNEGTGTKPWVFDVPTYDSESENESLGDSEDDNDDDSNDDNKGDDDKADSDDDGNSDFDDNERTNSDDDENPSFTLKD